MKDDLGNRMKEFYENRTRISIPRKTYGIIRVDGKAFHSYTKDLKRPFDDHLIKDMQETALYLCKEIQGAIFAYTQSDEISIVFTDISENNNTEMWFDGNIQKISSISASLTTSQFNHARRYRDYSDNLANFDARVFSIPQRYEVLNYLYWRQLDATRNSIQMVARSVASHKECNNLNTDQLQELFYQKTGGNWNSFPIHQRRGTCIYRTKDIIEVWAIDKKAPIFSKDWNWFDNKI